MTTYSLEAFCAGIDRLAPDPDIREAVWACVGAQESFLNTHLDVCDGALILALQGEVSDQVRSVVEAFRHNFREYEALLPDERSEKELYENFITAVKTHQIVLEMPVFPEGNHCGVLLRGRVFRHDGMCYYYAQEPGREYQCYLAPAVFFSLSQGQAVELLADNMNNYFVQVKGEKIIIS